MSTIEKALAKQKIAQQEKAPSIVENTPNTISTEVNNSSANYSNNDILQLNKKNKI